MGNGAREILLRKITKRERILITRGMHQYLGLSLMIVFAVTSFYLIFNFFHNADFNLVKLSFVMTALMLLLVALRLCFSLADVAINRDDLIMNQLLAPCRVISLEDISEVKTFRFYFFTITKLKYSCKCDSRNIIFLKCIKKSEWCPEEIIKFVCNPV